MNRPAHVVEYVLLRGTVGLFRLLPYRAALALGWVLAVVAHYGFRFRAESARARIRAVLAGELDERQVRRVAWGSWRNLVFCAVDLARLSRITPEWIRRHVEGADELAAKLRQQLESGRGAIVACPHMGAWEMGGVVAQQLGIPIFVIAALQKNPLVTAHLERMRQATGIGSIGRGTNLLRGIVRRLRKGDVLAILPDVRVKVEAVPVRLFGKQANLGAGIGHFARLADVPVFPAVMTRRGWTRHRMRLFDPIHPDPDLDKRQDTARITQQLFDIFEPAILAQPEQWFWYNKRWLLDPLDE